MKRQSVTAYIAFGANLGAKQQTVEKAIVRLAGLSDIRLRRVSSLYRTAAIGGAPQPDYLNGVVCISTTLSSLRLLNVLQTMEKQFGRVRRERWGARTLDLDLLAYGNQRRRSRRLTLPHPRYHERRFVLVPFCELAPRYVHPALRFQNRDLLRELTLPGQRVTMVGRWKKSRFYRFKKEKKKRSRSSPSPVMTPTPRS